MVEIPCDIPRIATTHEEFVSMSILHIATLKSEDEAVTTSLYSALSEKPASGVLGNVKFKNTPPVTPVFIVKGVPAVQWAQVELEAL